MVPCSRSSFPESGIALHPRFSWQSNSAPVTEVGMLMMLTYNFFNMEGPRKVVPSGKLT